MPHIIIEHSKNISKSHIQDFESKIMEIMQSITEGNFDLEQCKVRSQSFCKYRVGSFFKCKSGFIHVTIKILSGRTLETRKKVSNLVGDYIRNCLEKNSKPCLYNCCIRKFFCSTKRCDVSVDIVEMDKEIYYKNRIGS